MRAIIAVISFALTINLVAAAPESGSKQPPLRLKSAQGIEVIIEYSSEFYKGPNSFGVDIHIEKVVATGKNKYDLNEIEIYLNDKPFRVQCSEHLCLLEPQTKERIIHSFNIFHHAYSAKPVMRSIYASFFLNGKEWLLHPEYYDAQFRLMFRFPNQESS